MSVSKTFFKRLNKLKDQEEYQQAQLEQSDWLQVESHHKTLYCFFLDNVTGDVASALRTAKTARESFRVRVTEQGEVQFRIARVDYVLS